MQRDTTSPFSPGRPVPVEFFVGRLEQIERLRRKVRDATAARRIEVAFVSGERGIGKSSLAQFVRHLCEKEQHVLGIHAYLGSVDTIEGAVYTVFDSLLKETYEGTLFESIKGLFGRHIRQVGLFGVSVEFSARQDDLTALTRNFDTALRSLLEKVGDRKKSILLILDDINGLATSEPFANWFKSFVDGVSTSGRPIPLTIMLVGLDERRQSLIKRQPSVARILDPIDISSWSTDESRDFFLKAFEKARVVCEEKALNLLIEFTGGLPVLAHEIGDATYVVDRDNVVDSRDALEGVVSAAEIVGHRYLDPMVYKSIRSRQYRTILRRMAKDLKDPSFTRATFKQRLSEPEKQVFDNFLRKMKNLGVVVEDPDSGRGSYRFTSLLHFLYFSMEAGRAEQMKE